MTHPVETSRSERIQRWIADRPWACVILYGLLLLSCAAVLFLVFGGLWCLLTGKPLV